MAIALNIEFSEDVTVRNMRRIGRAMHQAMGERWLRKYLPLHFRQQTRRRYGFQKRKSKYLKNKQRLAKTGEVEDSGRTLLVHSGDLRRAMSRRFFVRAFPSRATINMPGPSYARMRPRDPRKPNLGFEITAVTPAEHADLIKHGLRVGTKLLNEPRPPRRRRFRG